MDYCFARFGIFCSKEEGVDRQPDVEENCENAQRIPPFLLTDKLLPRQTMVEQEDDSEAKRSNPGAAAEAASSCLSFPSDTARRSRQKSCRTLEGLCIPVPCPPSLNRIKGG